nr:glycosyltransferase [Gammaproteobacteria bacterium]
NIKVCIESVVDLVDEIIFVNNNSTDNTLKLIEEYALKYPKIKVYQIYLAQLEELIKNPPGDDWNGVFILKRK